MIFYANNITQTDDPVRVIDVYGKGWYVDRREFASSVVALRVFTQKGKRRYYGGTGEHRTPIMLHRGNIEREICNG